MGVEQGRFKSNTDPGEHPVGRKFSSDITEPKTYEPRLAKHIRSANELEKNKTVDMVKNILNIIDFKTMRNIIGEETQRSGGDIKDMNFLGRDKILVYEKDEGTGAKYELNVNRININARHRNADHLAHIRYIPSGSPLKNLAWLFRKEFWRVDLPPETLETLNILQTLLHEEWHACGELYLASTERNQAGEPDRVGYEYQVYERRIRDKWKLLRVTKRTHFNEAVTEQLGDESLLEYVRRMAPIGISRQDAERFVRTKQYRGANGSSGPYRHEQFFLGCALEAISLEQGIPTDQVWNAIKRGYIRGVPLEEVFTWKSSSLMKQVSRGIKAPNEKKIVKSAYAILKRLPKERRRKLEELYLRFPPGCV